MDRIGVEYMINDTTKTVLVIAIAALAAVGLIAFADDDADSYAADASEDVEYNIYLQLNMKENSFETWLPSVNEKDLSKGSFNDAITTACDSIGIEAEINGGWLSAITVDGVRYSVAGNWSTGPYWGFAQYYYASDSWDNMVSTYDEGSTIAIVFDQYLFEAPSAADADKYIEQKYGDSPAYYVFKASPKDVHALSVELNGHGVSPVIMLNDDGKYVLPTPASDDGYIFGGWYMDAALTEPCNASAVVDKDSVLYAKWSAPEYSIYLQLSNGTDGFKAWLPPVYNTGISQEAFNESLTAACNAVGIDVEIKGGWINSFTVNDVTYKIAGVWQTGPYFGFSQFYLNGDSWNFVNTFDEGNTVAIVFDQYLFEAPSAADADRYIEQQFGDSPAYYVPKASPSDTFAVGFQLGDYGTPMKTVSVADGALLSIEDPTDDKCNFLGWYTDADLTQKFDMSTPITEGMTLYASWSPENSVDESFIYALLVVVLLIMFVVPILFYICDSRKN